ncbi:MAG: indole-3-glycerol phosphate synthase TrpC [Rhodospirillaceae bacterium]
MADVLEKINAVKREAVAKRKLRLPFPELEAKLPHCTPARGFAKALDAKVRGREYGLIAEIKKASPSAGLIRPDFNAAKLAQSYARGGAACLSVLTEEDHFQGADDYMRAARAATRLPVLRKDFMLEIWQVAESRVLGADCILLIMACLDDTLAADMEAYAHEIGLDVLIEVHDEPEFERAMKLKSPLIGVNNRNLKTLQIDLGTTERLAKLLPKDRVLVAESGLKTQADLARMARAGARRFLIGESLMREPDVELATRRLLTVPTHV